MVPALFGECHDLLHGQCVGDCTFGTPRPFKKTVKGLYHK